MYSPLTVADVTEISGLEGSMADKVLNVHNLWVQAVTLSTVADLARGSSYFHWKQKTALNAEEALKIVTAGLTQEEKNCWREVLYFLSRLAAD